MKTNLLNSTLAALAVIMFTVNIFATPVEPVRTMEIPFLNWIGAPELNGVPEDVYGEVQTTNIFNPTGHDGDADFTAVFRVCWDPSYL